MGHRIDGNSSIMKVNDLCSKGQADPIAFSIFFIGAAIEGGEDIRNVLRRDADAGIGET